MSASFRHLLSVRLNRTIPWLRAIWQALIADDRTAYQERATDLPDPEQRMRALAAGSSLRLATRSRWSLAFALQAGLAAALLPVASAQAASNAAVTVEQQDRAVRVFASAVLKADLRTAWDTLVDYERLPEFVPDMRSSTVLRRQGSDVLVQQSGRAGFGPVQRNFSLTLRLQEQPMQQVTAHAVDGDFRRFESSYRLRAGEGGFTHLEYRALIEPKDGIPPLVGVTVMRWAIQRQFEALLGEIERANVSGPARPIEPFHPTGATP
jgi:ribosome-associated toxin RatA of RatAB toxin-antitoxin module